MKILSIVLLAFTLASLNQSSEALSPAAIATIKSIFGSYGLNCKSVYQNGVMCELIWGVQQSGLCIQDLIDYLIQICGLPCYDILKIMYKQDCGCIREIEDHLKGLIGWNIHDILNSAVSNNCNMNEFLRILFASKYRIRSLVIDMI